VKIVPERFPVTYVRRLKRDLQQLCVGAFNTLPRAGWAVGWHLLALPNDPRPRPTTNDQ
jgi:hypothetical protein